MAMVALVENLVRCGGMQVATRSAELDAGERCAGGVLADGHDDLVDAIACALVINERARAELGDAEEARTGKELVGASDALAAGDIGRKGQAGKTITRQERLAREVAVGIEV